MRWLNLPLLATCLLTLCACGGSDPAPSTANASIGQSPPNTTELLKDNLAIPDNRTNQPLQILFFGNSHSNSLLRQSLQTLLQTGTQHQVKIDAASGLAYLDERWFDKTNMAALTGSRWTHLVLQAQKYSQSGQTDYSTQETQLWIASAKRLGMTPVLYPEHPQRGNAFEGSYVFQLHQTIAKAQRACVAPIGPVWDNVNQQYPLISLYSNDGNHFNATGALLTAYVMYEVITGNHADSLPDIASLGIPSATQQLLRQAASAGLQRYPACAF